MSETLPSAFYDVKFIALLRNCHFNDGHSRGFNASRVLALKKEARGDTLSPVFWRRTNSSPFPGRCTKFCQIANVFYNFVAAQCSVW